MNSDKLDMLLFTLPNLQNLDFHLTKVPNDKINRKEEKEMERTFRLKNAPDDYINKPYYYQENDKIVEEIPTTILQIQKLFAEHKGEIALSKENLKSNIFVENIHDFYLQKDKEKRRLFIVLKELKEERKRAKYKEI